MKNFFVALSKADCCPGDTIPTDLVATITIPLGICSCFGSASVDISYSTMTQQWSGTGLFGGCGMELIELTLSCPTGPDCNGFVLDVENCITIAGETPLTCNCDPFNIVFAFGASNPCGCTEGGVTINITITE